MSPSAQGLSPDFVFPKSLQGRRHREGVDVALRGHLEVGEGWGEFHPPAQLGAKRLGSCWDNKQLLPPAQRPEENEEGGPNQTLPEGEEAGLGSS